MSHQNDRFPNVTSRNSIAHKHTEILTDGFLPAHNIFHSGVEMDSQQQQFCLKWNSFGTNLATSFSNLFKSETLADVTLFCDGESNTTISHLTVLIGLLFLLQE
jgi:hypothetical protein